ncbi:MAG TPA: hypothetical protein VHT27_07805 [Solirubrobacteraceae bacterium]|nr:hypothetical protein [Solirubrobacteraceae bacterium]
MGAPRVHHGCTKQEAKSTNGGGAAGGLPAGSAPIQEEEKEMKAKHGSVSASRAHGRLIGCCVMLALALAGFIYAPAAASAATSTYIASGDSITFGITDEKFNVNYPNEAPAFFEEGFDHWFNADLNRSTEVGKSVIDVNTACPSESTETFIGENEAIGGEKSTEPAAGSKGTAGIGDWHPCGYQSVEGFPLHYSAGGEHSQLEEILSILKEGKPAHPVRAITLNLGGSDELALVEGCTREVQEEYEREGKSHWAESPELAVKTCIGTTAENVTIPHVVGNVSDILKMIDSTEAGGGHYSGAIVLVGFYNPDSFTVPGSDILQNLLNEKLEQILPKFSNVTFANPFPIVNKGAFHEKLEAKEQESICKYTEMCNPNVQVPGGEPAGKDGDQLPTLAGDKLLATLVNKAWLSNPAK